MRIRGKDAEYKKLIMGFLFGIIYEKNCQDYLQLYKMINRDNFQTLTLLLLLVAPFAPFPFPDPPYSTRFPFPLTPVGWPFGHPLAPPPLGHITQTSR